MADYEDYQTSCKNDITGEHNVLLSILSDEIISRAFGIRKIIVNPLHQIYRSITEEGDCILAYEKFNSYWQRIIEGPNNAIKLTESKLTEILEKSLLKIE